MQGQSSATPLKSAPFPSRKDLLLGLLLLAATILAYQPAWHAGFIWDDDVYVTANPLLNAPDGLRRIWFSLDSPSQYFPLTYTTFYLEHALWGLNPAGYHLVNILLHAANALLAWGLLMRLRVPGAWVAAAIFALHPVQVESVAWITERKNVLMVFFFLLALLAWTKFLDEKCARPWRFYFLTLIFCALALSAKTTACTLPAALLLVLWLQKKPVGWQRLAQAAPFVVLCLGMGLVTVWWERYHQFTQGEVFEISPLERVLIASRAVWFYAGKLLWPVNLTFSYPRWTISTSAPLAYVWLLATAVLGWTIWFARRWTGRSLEVAAMFFVVTLSPVLGFIMLYTFAYSFVADHYQYLACLGPIALAVAAMERAFGWMTKKRIFLRPIFYAALLTVLGALTWRQCRSYADEETLWRATIARNPDCWLAYNNLGALYLEKKEFQKSIDQCRKALEIKPDDVDALCNWGNAFFTMGDLDEAVAKYRAALQINPAYKDAHYNLGTALFQKGSLDEAIAQFREALQIKPRDVEVLNSLGTALAKKGNLDEAIAQFRKALEINPDHADALNNLGNALFLKGDLDGAAASFNKSTANYPEQAEAWYGLGNIFLQKGDMDQAIARYRQAIKISPRHADAYANLGIAFFQKGLTKEAMDALRQALEINPEQINAANNLAWLLATTPDASLRNGTKAVALAEQANQLSGGGDPAILHTLAAADAEAGRFAQASVTARQALELAVAQKNDALAATLQKEIQLYEADTPLRAVTR